MKTLAPSKVRIPVSGPFDLAEVAMMGFGHRDESRFDGVMRMAFCLDDGSGQVGVEARQDGTEVELTIVPAPGTDPDPGEVAAQAARVMSIDHDGEAYADICRADPVLERVWRVAPGFRPANFYSPYEGAVWSILSARRSRKQAIPLRDRLGREHGATFELAGESLTAAPTPQQLRAVTSLAGLPADRIPRLHAIAEAAERGELALSRLNALDPAQAMAELQLLPGIGPFYSSLIVIRASGRTDVLPNEGHVREAATELYGREFTDAEFAALAEGWRPFRTWIGVMLRALGGRVTDEPETHPAH